MASRSSTNVVAAPSMSSIERSSPIARLDQVSSLAGQVSSAGVQELLDCLGDQDPLIASAAGGALAKTITRLRGRAKLGLPIGKTWGSRLTFSGLFTLLCEGLEDADPGRRAASAQALALCGYEPAIPPLVQAMGDSQRLVRASVAMALGQIGV